MMKSETFQILKQISLFYDQFEVNQEKVDLWHKKLKIYPFDVIENKLLAFVSKSEFSPKLSQLIPMTDSYTIVPNSEDTKKLLMGKNRASESVVQREMAKIRIILGIDRERAR